MFIRSDARLAATALLALAGCDDNQVRKFGTTRDGGSDRGSRIAAAVGAAAARATARHARVSATPQDASADGRIRTWPESPTSGRTAAAAASSPARAPVSRGQESLMEAAGPAAAPANIRERLTSDAQLGAVDPALSERILTESPHPACKD